MVRVGQYLTDLPEERIANYRLMAANAREAAEAQHEAEEARRSREASDEAR